ncbi:MAG: 2Fe-2S iron-sulfur cluster-binding protein [Comamonadaceae bacterium]|nr:2Fe-2S iron-sulfur cluster-binding protein [Comamonadaceae bacterium]
MTLFIALNEIREKQDPSLQFDFVCRAGICGSCAHGDRRPAGAGLPHADQEPRHRDHAGAAAGLRADRRPVGQHRQVDARA